MSTPQPSLIALMDAPDPLPPYQKHSQTSREAAASIVPSLNALQSRVLAYIAAHEPCTDEQIAEGLSLNPSTARPRRIELKDAELIQPTPEKGRTKSGRKADQWVLTQAGREARDRHPAQERRAA